MNFTTSDRHTASAMGISLDAPDEHAKLRASLMIAQTRLQGQEGVINSMRRRIVAVVNERNAARKLADDRLVENQWSALAGALMGVVLTMLSRAC